MANEDMSFTAGGQVYVLRAMPLYVLDRVYPRLTILGQETGILERNRLLVDIASQSLAFDPMVEEDAVHDAAVQKMQARLIRTMISGEVAKLDFAIVGMMRASGLIPDKKDMSLPGEAKAASPSTATSDA